MTENRLLEVAGHWLPRMEVAGLPSAMTKAVIEAAGRWENWCSAWCAEGDRHAALASRALELGRRVTAGEAYARAALCYHFGQFMFFDDLQQKENAARCKVESFRNAIPLLDPPGELALIPFEGGALHGVLRKPEHGDGHVAILLPGSDSTKEEFPALENYFLKRGIATFSLDGPGQGEGRSHGALRADIGPAVCAVVDYLLGRSEFSGRIALVGMAFGGHLALRAGASERRLSGLVSINGFHSLADMWSAFPPVYRDNMRFALGAGSSSDAEQLAADFTLTGVEQPNYPVLVLHGGLDRIFPAIEAQRQVEWAGHRGEIYVFPDGNHVCNNIAWLYRPFTADWVADRLNAPDSNGNANS